jgi:hypothetical protein
MIIRFNKAKELKIVPYNDELSQAWYRELNRQKDNIKERYRIHGFDENDTYDNAITKLKKCIGLIQLYDPSITYGDNLNEQHLFFESMMKEEYFAKAPSIVKTAIIEYNLIIHRLESFGSKRIVCTFNSSRRFKLDESHQERFDFDQEPGTVCLNYCHIGKPYYDLYHDNDDIAQKIIPQTEWCADFTIIYKHGKHKPFDASAQAWLDKNGYEKKSWGLIAVGKVVRHLPDYLDGINYIESLNSREWYKEIALPKNKMK